MTLAQFIKENRADIDAAINGVLYRHDGNGGQGTIPDPPPERTDDERREWILNNEDLYLWAKSAGVQV